ncbi:uracil-DNA glycosylase [Hoeflea prorocentri]|uniref:Type-4 uracil-DNA glycosylase n=1 Tax=Hoeflea prorocentri TaxID=1922333 RepID=A0A9X3UIL4_9HYPH|nr:uracil-DNA glycosylase [Hoeflea prorocentri]MCY6381490.1 uracil-DNA glycosylase [Hoeflea prorocentri]MDA5399290.1 uracil-DNA glycosylase [Hoeflea prorocentri]
MVSNDADLKQPPSDGELATLLHFYGEAGVDCTLADEAINRFTEITKPRPSAPVEASPQPEKQAAGQSRQSPAAPARQPVEATVPDEAVITDARETARKAETIEALKDALASFNGCNLRFGARSTVFADGNPQAPVMFIGEAPGRDEDRQGLPFVGRAGQLLDRMLKAIDLDRTGCYITNMIPWRPPGNRTPTPLEIELCRPFIERHVELVAPKVVVLMGNVSTKALLGTTRGILSMRGTWSQYHPNSDTGIPALPTLHPAYLLRNPAQKRLSWQDFLSVRDRLDTFDG